MAAPTAVPFLDVLDPKFDFTSPEVMAAQERNWYADSPIGIFVLRYAEANELLRDQRLNHNGQRFLEMNGIVEGPVYDWFVPMIVNHDGEHHRRLRGLVNKAFTPRMIHNLRPFIMRQAELLAERFEPGGVIDFVEEFTKPLPMAVMCELLGVPAEDQDTFGAWTTDIGMVFSLANGGDIAVRVEAAVVGLNRYVDSLLDAERAGPGDDLITALLAAHREESRISREELSNLIVTLVFAAHDNTRHQLANAMVAFAANPEQWTILGQRPELTAQAVEEVIRWCPSATSLYRFAAEDFEYRGLRVTEGTFFTMAIPTAQRDPRVFRDGTSFDITIARQAQPLEFGAGPHHCLGAALARAEFGAALRVLTSRLGPPVVAGPVTWGPPIGIYGPENLRLTFGAPNST